jgi:hypothetical protein
MRKVHAAIWLALLLVACDTKSGTDGGGPGYEKGVPTPDLPPAPTGMVTTKAAGESVDADFSKATQYLIVPYSVSETAADAIEFTLSIKSAGGAVSEKTYALKTTPQARPAADPAFLARWRQRLKVEAWLRQVAERSARMPHSLPPQLTMPLAGADCTTSDKCDAGEVCNALKCASDLTINVGSFSSTATITAKVRKKGTKAAILVDSADDASVTEDTVNALLSRFEKVVLPRDVALFGDPPLKGTDGITASDRNGDGLVWLVLTSKVKEKSAVGFFVSTDFTDDAKSNKADILYIDATAKQDSIFGTCAHELQHLLNYSSKVYKPKANGGTGALEAAWLDEGQAHLAEDACGFGGENTTLLRQAGFPDFSDRSLLSTDTVVNDDKTGPGARAVAFLFVRYLFEQKLGVTYGSDGTITDKGGAAFLKALHTSTKQGVNAVNAALAGTFADWKAGYDNWMAAMSLDGRGFTTYARYVYQGLENDPVTNNQIGVKIRGERKDNTGATVQLTGPLETDATVGDNAGTVPNASAKLFLLKGQTGTITVKVTCKDSDFRFAVIKLAKE